jgi:mono/diheme cytochrome c family protein
MLKKVVRALAYLILAVVVVAAIGASWLFLRSPASAPPSSIKVSMVPDRIARGKYIFESVSDCGGCHSQRDFTRLGGPEVPGRIGAGVILSDLVKGLPGVVVASNITPDNETGIGTWTDGEKIRAIREGVDRYGHALFPMMPYEGYSHLSDEDVQSVVAFLDSLAPIHNPLPKTKLNFPVGLMIKGVPKPAGTVAPPDKSDPIQYGRYLVTVGGCGDCHTPTDKQGAPLPGKLLAGGRIFETTYGTVVTSNITPDNDTGIGAWNQAAFVGRFYAYKPMVTNEPPPATPATFTLMPWLGSSQQDEDSLKAIYAYLRTVPPVSNHVVTHPPAATSAPAK